MGSGTKTKEWSRAILCRPKDNLVTEGLLRAQRYVMVSSVEKTDSPPSISLMLAGEYARTWQEDREEFQKKTDNKRKKKFIKNDFEWWLKLRKTNKCFCSI
ncbi:hypothetical protein KR222_007837 [Zaprionus bogoriensis]|nr:hypothetical protein KR222_007837 [Zaprionus bogoriensis]